MADVLNTLLGVGWLPAAVVVAGVLAGLVADMTERTRGGLRLIAGALVIASLLCVARALVPPGGGQVYSVVFDSVSVGGGLAGLAGVIYLVAFLSVGTGLTSVRESIRCGAAALIALGAVAAQVLLGASDLAILFLALEAIALVGYALVAAAGTNRADEAAARYFVQGAVATGLTVYGLAVLVGMSAGATSYADLVSRIGTMAAGPALLGTMLLMVSLAFKLGAFPFHSWAPDAYETAPAPAAAFLASGPKIAALVALVILVDGVARSASFARELSTVIAVMAAASIVFGNFAALRQTSVARMLGYSGIAQVGYALVGIGVGASGSTVFAATYGLGVAGAFLAVEALRSALPDWDGSVAGLAGAARAKPFAAFALTVSLLSLTGIPLTAGFFGKALVFLDAVEGSRIWLAIVGVVGSVVSFGYYGRVIRALYIDEPGMSPVDAIVVPEGERTAPGGSVAVWPALFAAALVLVIGVVPMVTGFGWLQQLFRL